jgi:hypothetical protein
VVVADIPKRERPPETIRVSLIPVSGGYADLRVYRGGLPTRQGLVIHKDLLPEVLAGLGEGREMLGQRGSGWNAAPRFSPLDAKI